LKHGLEEQLSVSIPMARFLEKPTLRSLVAEVGSQLAPTA
jgi:hypothetical protein